MSSLGLARDGGCAGLLRIRPRTGAASQGPGACRRFLEWIAAAAVGLWCPLTGPIQVFLLGVEDFAVTGRIVTIRIIDARFLVKESEDDVMAVRASDLDEEE